LISHSFLVIAGLDPAIHAAWPPVRLVSMDHRVKPGGDEQRMERESSATSVRVARQRTPARHAYTI